MSDHFSGFSQEEIKKVSHPKTKRENLKEAFQGQHVGIRRATAPPSSRRQEIVSTTKLNNNANKKPNTNLVSSSNSGGGGSVNAANKNANSAAPTSEAAAAAAAATINDNNNDSLDDVNLNRSMSKSLEEALFYQPMKVTSTTTAAKATGIGTATATTNGHITAAAATAADDSSLLHLSTVKAESEVSTTSTTDANSIDDSSILHLKSTEHTDVQTVDLNVDSPFKGVSLKDFESHRKLIEEQNRQKKVLLQKAIEHHSQKTAAEARKIEEIRSELAKLDNDLAVDVAILRKQIDNACIHFTNIEKNYIKIEAQFLKAKMDLHNASEKKELLTEHLCTVIAHNEDRKAQKLSELMQKVGLTPTGEYGDEAAAAQATTNGSETK